MTTFFFDQALLPQGWAKDVRATVGKGVFTAVEPGATVQLGDRAVAAVLPGLPNLHSHAFQRGMAGLAEVAGPGDDSFWTWRETMYRFAAAVTPDDLQAIAALAYVEMLETGFTRVGEFHYLHGVGDAGPQGMTEAIVAAAAETGIALTHLPVFYAHGGFGGAAPGERQKRFVLSVDDYAALVTNARYAARALPDAVVGVAPHSLRAVTPEELAEVARLGDGPVHIHVAEQVKEVEDCLAWSGARPVEWLLANAPIDVRWCTIHATHMTAAETRALAAAGAVAGLCPITEANLGDGLFPAESFLAAGGAYGVGSDSNVRIDTTEELRLLEYGQRLAAKGRTRLVARGGSNGDALWGAAASGGARALGARAEIAVGAAADFVALDLTHPSLVGRAGAALTDALVFSGGREAVSEVWRRGERMVTAGWHRHRERIVERYRRTIARLLV
jgi:formimidoylglutamate deiminase